MSATQNTPTSAAPEVGATASTTSPMGARTGAAGSAPAPGRSTPPTDGTWFTITNATGEKFEARVIDEDEDTGLLTIEYSDGEREDASPEAMARIYTPTSAELAELCNEKLDELAHGDVS